MMSGDTKSRGGHGEKRSRKLDLFLAAPLSSPTVESAAATAGISRMTAYRWMTPDVIARLRQAGQETWGRASAQIQAASLEAVECLRKIMREGANESARGAAAARVLELGQRVVEVATVLERLEKLERIAKSRDWKGPNDDREDQAPTRPTGGTDGHA
jgi:hypothetical protein